ncbi:LacI family transcriptional regulator [Paragemmobacter straminiformis]|uniref:LacI family DNA-binding transcriptional regulator n=1 Tax=Paragemmobacter straminiformis TaxID=2045119 RepID=A0A842IA17_9RHOB|nr:LacI family transcriptional regulator [Gemmobacter straminiformis]MBC2835944.1 LacI family DNA-binding transcriptional regulator [Gemmobacter straminiformis]
MSGKPTLRTISAASGFAVTTVSRALSGDEKIAESTRREVSRIAELLGYVPDRAAQRLRTGRTNVIALVLSPHEEIIGFRGSMIAGLQQAFSGTSYHIVMAPYDGDADPMVPVQHILRHGLADGIVFSGTRPDDPRISFLNDAGFPFVSHGRTDSPQVHAWCDYDNDSFARLAVTRLVARGRKSLLLIPPQPDRTYARHMREGFFAAVAATGAEGRIDGALTLATKPALLQEGAAGLVERHGIDGLICPGEVSAMAVLAGLHDRGVRIGTDVDVIAKQTSETFGLYRPRIDTIYEDIRAAGEAMGHLLLRRIAGEPPEGLTALLAPTVNFRQ